ncbi:MAG: Eco57I restriction-modification methylase domain-containing protein [Candidatus Helarchaeota archaeon]
MDAFTNFLVKKGFEEEKDYEDVDYPNGKFFKIADKKLLAVYKVEDIKKVNKIKNHFLIEKGLSYCAILNEDKIIFLRNFGEGKYFLYSDRTKFNVSKIDKLNNIHENFDVLFYKRDISGIFYEDFKRKRNLLARNIVNNLPATKKYLLAQRIFDRIFFTYFLCHKGIIKLENNIPITGKNLFSDIFNNGNFFENLLHLFKLFNTQENNILLIDEFRIKIPYLNGGLFRPDKDELNLKISLDDRQWKEIFNFLNEYHWIIEDIKSYDVDEEKILTPEILGHVYERSVVEWESIDYKKAAEKALTDKSERKSKGVYYTPENITEYITHNSINNYINNKFDIDNLESYINNSSQAELEKLYGEISNIKILDPACGSGAFLIKAAEMIYYYKRRILFRLQKEYSSYDLKIDIITNNIYGVDILSGASEIAKLRLWLWIISEIENDDFIMPLPNIEYNIKVGDSILGWLNENLTKPRMYTPLTDKIEGIFLGLLVHSSIEESKSLSEIKNLLNTYNLSNYIDAYNRLHNIYKKAHGLKAEYLRQVIETIRNSIYDSVNKPYIEYVLKNYSPKNKKISMKDIIPFHWAIDFGSVLQNGGFDIIIGNPPYFNLKSNDVLKHTKYYSKLSHGVLNSAALFISRSTELLRKNGTLGFIIPKSYIYVESWSLIRKYVVNNYLIYVIADVSRAFKEVLLEQIILLGRKNDDIKNNNVLLIGKFGENNEVYNIINQERLKKEDLYIFNSDYLKIYEVMHNKSILLDSVSNNYRGIGAQKYSTDNKRNKNQLKIIGGKQIMQFGIKKEGRYIEKKYLKEYKKANDLIKKKRIIAQNIVAHIRDHIKIMAAIYDNLVFDTVNNIEITDNNYSMYYILGLLNSKLINFYVYNFIYFNAIRTMHFDSKYTGQIPVKKIEVKEQEKIVNNVKEIINLTNRIKNKEKKLIKERNKKISLLDHQIYELYGLNNNMINLVEEQFQ